VLPESAPGVPDAIARVLCEFAALPVADDRVGVLASALGDILKGRDALAQLDLTDVEPAAAFDVRWE
jgi:Asp-tRNA(Asn)/Glu-tRNA(Gln) amidotransferase C subunit